MTDHSYVHEGFFEAPASARDAHPSNGAGASPVDRLRAGVRRLGGRRLVPRVEQRLLLVLGGVLAPMGVVLILFGWLGAARTPHVFEQVPYLISGGLVGLALAFLGGFLYFAHWLTELVREQRAQSAAVVDAIGRLEAALASRSPATMLSPAAPAAPASGRVAAGLVATRRGTMVHRADCVVVARRQDLRAVAVEDGLAPCQLCHPLDERQ
jgi:hypothetical protein